MELDHYGVLGMKWGVRRTPEELGHRRPKAKQAMVDKGVKTKQGLAKDVLGRDLSYEQLTSKGRARGGVKMAKGQSVQHITGVNFDGVKKSQLYVTATKDDNYLYQSFLGMRLLSKGFDPKTVVLKLKQDLSAPSSKDQYEMFKKYAKENRKQIEKDVKEWAKSKGKDMPEMAKDEDLYEHFMNSVERSSSSQKGFYSYLKKKGYNAVLDEHDVTGSWMQAQKPLIIMEPLSAIGSVKVEQLTPQKMEKALDEWLKK